jgi:hypothetical protein
MPVPLATWPDDLPGTAVVCHPKGTPHIVSILNACGRAPLKTLGDDGRAYGPMLPVRPIVDRHRTRNWHRRLFN